MTVHEQILDLKARMQRSIIGQEEVIERLMIGLLADGNVLVEGLPGLAKTRAIKSLAKNLAAEFSRIQFTPDLLPADVTGTEIYYSAGGEGQFKFQAGPIFGNIVLADEINRAPAKVQAALLEAMKSVKSRSPARRTKCRNCSWSWQPRTRSNKKALIHCPKLRWIGFSCIS